MKRGLKALYLSLYDAVKEDFSYHASALTLQLLLVLAPMFVFFTAIIAHTPYLDIQKIERFIVEHFPSQTHKILNEIFKIQKYGNIASAVSLALSYFFSVGFIKKIAKSFSYIVEDRFKKKHEFFFWIFLPVSLVLFGILSSIFFSVSVFLKIHFKDMPKILPDVVSSLPFFLFILILYLSFVRIDRKVSLLFSGLFVFGVSVLLQYLFTLYTSYIFKGSVLYGSLSSVVLFLIWLNVNFIVILVGARYIYRYETLK
ncbi:YhjD/YihY/BrkB family envelope integrity protein [Aquifex sp.]